VTAGHDAGPPESATQDALHADALHVLDQWQAPDSAQEGQRRRFVDHLRRSPDGMRRTCFPAHVTASTLVVSEDLEHVLLTLHAKANAWFQLGGHCETRDLTLADAALREGVEESGVDALVLDPQPVHLDGHDVSFCHPRGTVEHLDVRFVATAPASAAHAVSEESLDVRWWPAAALPSREPGLVELVRRSRERLGART
jgi:8-oxo-dGTP pyrophosphatase MutT (NUDIX family)